VATLLPGFISVLKKPTEKPMEQLISKVINGGVEERKSALQELLDRVKAQAVSLRDIVASPTFGAAITSPDEQSRCRGAHLRVLRKDVFLALLPTLKHTHYHLQMVITHCLLVNLCFRNADSIVCCT